MLSLEIAVMDPLRAVEDILGDLETWPTYIITNMFIVEPNTISVKKVVAFLYGNGVPVERAIDCFNACMGLDSYYVSCAMRDWYFEWHKNPYKAEYYSMSLKRWMWINGMALNQQAIYMQFGTENTGCQQIIKTTFEHVRSCTAMSSDFQKQ